MAFPGPLGSETIRLPGDVRFPTQSGEPSVLGVIFLKCPKWCRSTKVTLVQISLCERPVVTAVMLCIRARL
jgi:hypothetical protein